MGWSLTLMGRGLLLISSLCWIIWRHWKGPGSYQVGAIAGGSGVLGPGDNCVPIVRHESS